MCLKTTKWKKEEVLVNIHDKRGISSLELAVVMALIAIMATFTIPYLGSWLKHYRVVGASREVASTLQEARIKAISNNREWRLVVDIDGNLYWLEQGDKVTGSGTWTPMGGNKTLPKGISITVDSYTTGQHAIQFNPSGTAQSGSIYVTGDSGEKYRLTVLSTTGRVWISVKKGSNWEPVLLVV